MKRSYARTSKCVDPVAPRRLDNRTVNHRRRWPKRRQRWLMWPPLWLLLLPLRLQMQVLRVNSIVSSSW